MYGIKLSIREGQRSLYRQIRTSLGDYKEVVSPLRESKERTLNIENIYLYINRKNIYN